MPAFPLRAAPAALVLLLAIPTPARGAEPPAPARDEMIVADLGQHVVGVGYQRSVSPYLAAQVAASYYQPWTQNIDFLGLSGEANKGGDLRGVIARARVFVHPFGAAPTGLWISPFVQAGVGWGLRNDERRAGPISAAGVSVGYSAMLTRSVLLGGGFGVQYHAARIAGGEGPPSFSRFYPQVDIQLGYVF
ncbi:hypothetical protein BH11MYX4_BH11MYX4_48850 [soil metagenome]